jgi:hypothetical protein
MATCCRGRLASTAAQLALESGRIPDNVGWQGASEQRKSHRGCRLRIHHGYSRGGCVLVGPTCYLHPSGHVVRGDSRRHRHNWHPVEQTEHRSQEPTGIGIDRLAIDDRNVCVGSNSARIRVVATVGVIRASYPSSNTSFSMVL